MTINITLNRDVDPISFNEENKIDGISIAQSGISSVDFIQSHETMKVFMQVGDTIYVTIADYNALANHPSINGVELIGNKTSEDLHIQSGGASTWSEVAEKPFEALGQSLKVENDILEVRTVDEAEPDNTLPITSNGVHEIVGNIGTLLELI